MIEKLNDLIEKAKRYFSGSLVKDWLKTGQNDNRYIERLTLFLENEIEFLEERLGSNQYRITALVEFDDRHKEREMLEFDERLRTHIDVNSLILTNLQKYKRNVPDSTLRGYFSAYRELLNCANKLGEGERQE